MARTIQTGPGFKTFNTTTLNSTAQDVLQAPGHVYGWNIVNPNVGTIYLKFYDKLAASVNPAVDVPVKILQARANDFNFIEPYTVQESFNTAISVRCVTGFAPTDTTAPATLPNIQIKFY